MADRADVKLLDILHAMESTAVALSGGVDSAVVAAAAVRVLGERAVAVTADSPSVARRDFNDAVALARHIGIRHHIVSTAEFDNGDYIKNDGTRCYFCKSELYTRVVSLLPQLGVNTICSGANLDDLGDYRPGLVAAAEHRVRHPLQEAGFTKPMVRALARQWELPVWDKPASPCLSSRIAPGVAVTPERTRRVEMAEDYLRERGFAECRVRHHDGDLARIEIAVEDLDRFLHSELRHQFTERCLALGFKYVTVDLAGFRSGSLNDMIPLEVRQRTPAMEPS
jgi:uncharacterized protein